jgi:predicted RNA-binding protein with TRAM domain
MKKFVVLLSAFMMLTLVLTGCGTVKPDYTTKQFETALNKGENLEGKTVSIEVDKLVPNSTFGYNIETGKHLNFVSGENPNVKKGDKLIVKVTKVQSVVGSYIITYEKK